MKILSALTLILACWLSTPPASAAINAAANRSALSATRLLDWNSMGTLGINVGNSEPVTVGAYGTVDVSSASGVLAQTVQTTSAITGQFLGNFTPGESLCYTTGAPITLSFPNLIRSLGFNVQSEAFGAFTARLRFYSGTAGSGTLLGTLSANGTSNENNNGTAVFIGGISDNISTDFRSVLIDLTAATSVPARMAINDVIFREIAAPAVTLGEPIPTGNSSATLNGIVSADGRSANVFFDYGPTLALGTTVNASPPTVTANGTPVSINLSGLTAGQRVYYRIGAVNSNYATFSIGSAYVHLGPGALDFSFSDDGSQITPFMDGATLRSSQGRDVAVQPDGKIVVAGFASNGTNHDFALARYKTDGGLDTFFSGTGLITTSFGSGVDLINALALQPDGKIVVAGQTQSAGRYVFALARYTSTGGLDTSFNGGGVTVTFGSGNDVALGVAVGPDGKITVVGYTTGATVDMAIARLNADGTPDFTFDGDGKRTLAIGSQSEEAFDVAVLGDGKTLVAGYSFNAAGNPDFTVARLLAGGGLDATFGSGGIAVIPAGTGFDEVRDMAVQADGRIVLAGHSYPSGSSNADFAVVRCLANGSLDTTFNGTGKVVTAIGSGIDVCNGVAVQRDGKIVCVGTANSASTDMAVVRYNPDGTLDTTFDGDGKVTLAPGTQDDELYALALDANGDIVAAGYSSFSSVPQFVVVRLIGGPNELLVNGGFEANESLGGGISTTFGDWKQDIAATVGAENGITPFEGVRMAKFLGTTDSGAQAGNADGDISQYVDLSAYAAQIAAGNVTVQVTARFNRVAGNANTDTSFRILLIARNGSLTTSPNIGSLGGNNVELISDGNPATWETLTNTWTLPPGTTNLFVNPYAKENVQDNSTAPEFAGHYMDGVTLTLIIPQEIQVEQPVGTILTDAASTVDFGSTPLGTPVTRTFRVTNRGGEDLHVTGLTLPTGYEHVGTFAPFTLAPNATQDLQIRFLANTVKGVFGGTMMLLSDDADEGSFDLALTARAIIGGNPAALDLTFNGTGKVTTSVGSGVGDRGHSVAIQSDGKIVVAGDSYTGSGYEFALMRLTTLGALDTTFGSGGKVTTLSGFGKSVALQSDGKIVVGGEGSPLGERFALMRYLSDGTLDASFGNGGKATTTFGHGSDEVRAIALQSDGKIVMAGSAFNGSNYGFAVVRFTAAGVLDSSFGSGGKVTTPIGSGPDRVGGVGVQSDGKIVVVGFSFNGSSNDFALVRYTAAGVPDSTFGNGGKATTSLSNNNDSAASVAFQPDGKIVVAGSGGFIDVALVRYATNGTPDASFGSGGKVITPIGTNTDVGSSVALQSDGRIVVAGSSYIGSDFDFAVVRYLSDGALDPSFGTGGKLTTPVGSDQDNGEGVALQSDGKIVVAGTARIAGADKFAVVRYGVDLQPTVITFTGTGYPSGLGGLTGSVNPNGVVTNVWFEWGTTAAYGQATAPQAVGYGNVAVTVGNGISGLIPGATYHFRIVAQNGETTAYGANATFVVPLNNNADLTNVTLGAGTLSPAFASATTNYAASVPHSADTIAVTVTREDVNASISLNGSPADSPNSLILTYSVNLNVGANTIDVLVRAQNGTTTKTYSVVVTRAGSPNADLGTLLLQADSILPVNLTPAFAPGVETYSGAVPFGTANIWVHALADDTNASVYVPGASGLPAAGTFTGLFPFAVGNSAIITITVIAQDGFNFKTYTVNMTRQTAYESWIAGYNAGVVSPATADLDGDGAINLFEFVFGTDPVTPESGAIIVTAGTLVRRGSPAVLLENTPTGGACRALFGRRLNYEGAGLTYTVQFSADLSVWENSTDTPAVIASDFEMEAVTVPFPLLLSTGAKAQFFRVMVMGP